jgi:molybdopterin synthase catalytic subunit
VAVGELAFVAVVAAGHRMQAFSSCAALVELVKAELPVWKHEFFADGSNSWVGV